MFRIKDNILPIVLVLVILGILWKTKIIEGNENMQQSSGTIINTGQQGSATMTEFERIESFKNDINAIQAKLRTFEGQINELRSNDAVVNRRLDTMQRNLMYLGNMVRSNRR